MPPMRKRLSRSPASDDALRRCREMGAGHAFGYLVQQTAEILTLRLRPVGEAWTPVPVPPPPALAKAFSRSGCGRIFPLFSRVMREGLSTSPSAVRPVSVLLGPIFSGPHDCANLVNFS